MSKPLSICFVFLTLATLAGCSTPQQTVGTSAGVATGAVVGGPVGAVVGGVVGGVATAPGMLFGAHRYCRYRNRYGHAYYRSC